MIWIQRAVHSSHDCVCAGGDGVLNKIFQTCSVLTSANQFCFLLTYFRFNAEDINREVVTETGLGLYKARRIIMITCSVGDANLNSYYIIDYAEESNKAFVSLRIVFRQSLMETFSVWNVNRWLSLFITDDKRRLALFCSCNPHRRNIRFRQTMISIFFWTAKTTDYTWPAGSFHQTYISRPDFALAVQLITPSFPFKYKFVRLNVYTRIFLARYRITTSDDFISGINDYTLTT